MYVFIPRVVLSMIFRIMMFENRIFLRVCLVGICEMSTCYDYNIVTMSYMTCLSVSLSFCFFCLGLLNDDEDSSSYWLVLIRIHIYYFIIIIIITIIVYRIIYVYLRYIHPRVSPPPPSPRLKYLLFMYLYPLPLPQITFVYIV